jgi:hypothetical protein
MQHLLVVQDNCRCPSTTIPRFANTLPLFFSPFPFRFCVRVFSLFFSMPTPAWATSPTCAISVDGTRRTPSASPPLATAPRLLTTTAYSTMHSAPCRRLTAPVLLAWDRAAIKLLAVLVRQMASRDSPVVATRSRSSRAIPLTTLAQTQASRQRVPTR